MAPSVIVGCMLLLTGTLPLVVMAPSVIVGCMLLTVVVPVLLVPPTVCGGVVSSEIDAVEKKHIQHIAHYIEGDQVTHGVLTRNYWPKKSASQSNT